MAHIYIEPKVEMDPIGDSQSSSSTATIESALDMEEWAHRRGVQLPCSSRASSFNSSVTSPRYSLETYRDVRNAVVKEKYLVPLLKSREWSEMDIKSKENSTGIIEDVEEYCASSDSDISVGEDNSTANRFMKTRARIVELAGGSQEVVVFNHIQFQKARMLKVYIHHLKNLELIAAGRADEREKVSHDWDDESMDLEFQKVFGAVDTKRKDYKKLRDSFRNQRMEFFIDLADNENEFIRCVASSVSNACGGALKFGAACNFENVRKQLETALMSLPEATIDINPYTSKMDFFILPRLYHRLDVYRIKATEMDHLVEFDLKSDEFSTEGYNHAVCDVGVLYPKMIVGDHRRREYFEGGGDIMMIPRADKWNKHLLSIKKKLGEYKHGVESKLFFEKYRTAHGLKVEDTILGKYSDDKVPFQLSDVFYPQVLGEGKDKRIILFPSVLEGLMLKPDEILLRYLKQVVFILEEEEFVKLDELKEKYKQYFTPKPKKKTLVTGTQVSKTSTGTKTLVSNSLIPEMPLFDPLDWGFERMVDVIWYLYKRYPEESGDLILEVLKQEEDKATYYEDGEETIGFSVGDNAEKLDGKETKESDDSSSEKQQPLEVNLQLDNQDGKNDDDDDDADDDDEWLVYDEKFPINLYFGK